MPFIDHHAADRLAEMREARGLSAEALAQEINAAAIKHGLGPRYTVHPHTLRRIEREGHVPGVRVCAVIAWFFDTTPHEMWRADHRRLRSGV